MSENQTYFFEFGEYRVDPAERRLLRGDTVIPLTPKAFETLCILLENSGRIVEKNRLMELLWADTFVEEGNLADNVSKIRQALGDNRKEPKFIETVSGRGYRFVAETRRIEEAAPLDRVASDLADPKNFRPQTEKRFQISNLKSEIGEEPGTKDEELKIKDQEPKTEITHPKSRTQSLKWLVSLLNIVAIVGAVFLFWRENGKSIDAPIKSIAVLPFKPLAANTRDDSLELGMSDSLITRLGSLRQITVRPISSVRRFTDLEQDAAAAGRELQVESVLEGTIQRAGERIRVTARLVRSADGKTLWTEIFDEQFADIFAVQDSISQKIVEALAVQLSGEERDQLTKKYTANTEAFQLYLKGRFFWSKRTPGGLEKSLEYYGQAIDIDPNYALAYAGLADSYNLLGSYGVLPLKESHPKGRAAAEKALELDGELAEAHTSLAAVIADYYWDWATAEKHFKLAIELSPNYPVAHYWYSQYLARMGRLDESIQEAKHAQTLDPVSASSNAHVGLALYRARHYDEAIAELQKALEIDPEALEAHIFLGFVYAQQEKSEEAMSEFQTVVKLSQGNASLRALLGYAYAAAGKKEEALAILKESNEQSTNQPISPFETAMIHIELGHHNRAFEWLERAYDERAWQMGFLKVEPFFDPLRQDPRFNDLIRRVNLPVN